MSESVIEAPADTGAFLGGTGTETPPPVSTSPSASFFRDDYLDGDKFKEGVIGQRLKDAGYERLANAAMKTTSEKEFFQSLDHAQSMLGKKGSGLPGPDASPHELAEFRRAAGIPEAPDKYDLTPKEEIPGVQISPEKSKELKDWAHKNNVSQTAMREMMDRHFVAVKENMATQEAALNQRVSEGNMACQKEFKAAWGDDFPIRVEANAQLVKSVGIDTNDPAMKVALSNPALVKLIDMARTSLRDGGLPGQGRESSPGAGSRDAQQQLQQFLTDNPGWTSDPAKSERVRMLSDLAAQQRKR